MARSEEITRELKGQILAGRLGDPGTRFLTVRELAERYRVALTTAQKVLRQLKDEGLLRADSTNPAVIAAGPVGPQRIGLVVTNITSPFFSHLCQQIQQAANRQGRQVLVAGSDYDFDRERRAIEEFLQIGVQGLLLCPGLDPRCEALYGDLRKRGVRLVFVSRQVPGSETDYVVVDNFVGGAEVAGHFLSLGYRSIGYIPFAPRLQSDARLSGFRAALSDEGIEIPAEWIRDGGGRGIEHGYQAMRHLMRKKKRPRAVFAFNDLLAIGALGYCRERGLTVPDEVAVAGFDDLPESRVTSPPLTTVGYPVASIADLAVQILLADAEHRTASRVRLEPHLVVRRSTDPAAPSAPTTDN